MPDCCRSDGGVTAVADVDDDSAGADPAVELLGDVIVHLGRTVDHERFLVVVRSGCVCAVPYPGAGITVLESGIYGARHGHRSRPRVLVP